MQIPLTFWDASLVLAVTAITLFVTVELASPYYGQTNLLINKRKLRNVALAVGMLFLATVAIRIISIISSP
jgi:hypothetical protein